MYSLSPAEIKAVKNCMARIAGGRKVSAACVYGSKAAGYARPQSDVDLLVVLEDYPFAIKYAYLRDEGVEVSILVVGKKSLEADAQKAALGEFAIGRLLHVYEPIENAGLLRSIEQTYKKRVILEQLQKIVNSASILATEIQFPLEYIVFAKIKERIARYPNAVYSYYRTYAKSKSSGQNLQFALRTYRGALEDVLLENPGILSRRDEFLQISDAAINVDRGEASLNARVKLQQAVGPYLIHTYAARKVMHLSLKEAESKIRRQVTDHVELPTNMQAPKKAYWRLPEGALITESRDWLQELAETKGIEDVRVSYRRRLGNLNSRTVLNVVSHSGGQYRIVVKELARTKSVKWAALSLWTTPVKRFKVGPMFRLGTEYKANRFVRALGLSAPAIEAVVLDERLLVTSYIEGKTVADAVKECIKGIDRFQPLRDSGSQIARIHNAGASVGNIKPKNIIIDAGGRLNFTDLEQFLFRPADQVWDLAQFICWDLKGTGNAAASGRVAREFLEGYLAESKTAESVATLAKSKRYIESFFPVMAPGVARAIKHEIRLLASS
jgi:tRNA A-37 threonylcarbamoyl transferase component Bud32/predicted nucleotidyltransferase